MAQSDLNLPQPHLKPPCQTCNSQMELVSILQLRRAVGLFKCETCKGEVCFHMETLSHGEPAKVEPVNVQNGASTIDAALEESNEVIRHKWARPTPIAAATGNLMGRAAAPTTERTVDRAVAAKCYD